MDIFGYEDDNGSTLDIYENDGTLWISIEDPYDSCGIEFRRDSAIAAARAILKHYNVGVE